MLQVASDLWTHPADWRCITTGGAVDRAGLVMDVGEALEAKMLFHGLPEKLGRWLKKYGNRPFVCRRERIVTFPNDTLPGNIIENAKLILQAVEDNYVSSVVMSRPSGLPWQDMQALLSPFFDDRFTVVHKG
jgi:hypothetical protein